MLKIKKHIPRLLAKARKSPCVCKLSAIAISKHGNVLGYCTNSHSKWQVLDKIKTGRPGTAVHCERLLMSKFTNQIQTIIICRVGNSGNLLPIEPCEACKKAAAKYGIKIISITPESKI